MKALIFLICGLMPFSAFAGVKVIGNGGDPLALEFSSAAGEVLSDLAMRAALYPELNSVPLSNALSGVKILVSDIPLPVESEGFLQNSVAVNDASAKTIVIYRAAWLRLSDPVLRKALALHELLGLAGIESTGHYPISQRYVLAQEPYCANASCRKPAFYQCSLEEGAGERRRELGAGTMLLLEGKRASARIGDRAHFADISLDEKEGVSISITWWKNGRRLGRNRQLQAEFPPELSISWEGEPSDGTLQLVCRSNAPIL